MLDKLYIITLYYSVQADPKTAQSLQHHNFAIVCHTVVRLSPKCSELLTCLNKAIKYSFVLLLASELFKKYL